MIFFFFSASYVSVHMEARFHENEAGKNHGVQADCFHVPNSRIVLHAWLYRVFP